MNKQELIKALTELASELDNTGLEDDEAYKYCAVRIKQLIADAKRHYETLE